MTYGPEHWTDQGYVMSEDCPHKSFEELETEQDLVDAGGYSVTPPARCLDCGLIFDVGELDWEDL